MHSTDLIIRLITDLPWFLIVTLSLLVSTAIALLNSDKINDSTTAYQAKLKKRFSQSAWYGKIFYSPSGLYMNAIDIVPDNGWRGGFAVAFPAFKILLALFCTMFIYLNFAVFWSVLIWPVLKVVLIIGVIIIALLIFANS